MDELEEVWSGLVTFTASYGLLSVATLQSLKSAGAPLPVRIGLLGVVPGVQAREGTMSLWLVWLVLTVASVLGTNLLFVFVRWISAADLRRYGRFVGLTEARLLRAETELHARGQPAIFVARLVPGLGLAIAVLLVWLGRARKALFAGPGAGTHQPAPSPARRPPGRRPRGGRRGDHLQCAHQSRRTAGRAAARGPHDAGVGSQAPVLTDRI